VGICRECAGKPASRVSRSLYLWLLDDCAQDLVDLTRENLAAYEGKPAGGAVCTCVILIYATQPRCTIHPDTLFLDEYKAECQAA